MTTWNPGDGGPDVLSSGNEGPPWADRARAAALAIVCLLAGAFLGTRLDDAGSPFSAQAAQPPAALTGGVVSAVDGNDPLPHRYQVGLFNPGERTVRVLVVGPTAWTTPVAANRGVDVPPHGWAHAAFALPGLCEVRMVPRVTAVRIRFVDPAVGQQRVELAEPTDAFRDDQDLECPPPTLLGRGQLTGLWHLEEVRGRWEDLPGKSLVRFTSDGRFAFDQEGRMFDQGNQVFFGTYRQHGSRLHLRADGGYACAAGYSEVWQTTQLKRDLLRLDVVRSDGGYCNSPPGERQILRRLLPERGLPPGRATGSR